MKIIITNKEVVHLFNTISNLSITGTPKFTYAMAKNRSVLEKTVEAIREADKSYAEKNARVAEFNTRGEELVKRYSTDKAGKINTRPTGQPGVMQRVVIAEKMQDYMQEKILLDEEFVDVLVGFDAHQRVMEGLMKEDTEVDLRLVPISEFPKEIPQAAMNILYMLVKDDEDKKADVVPLRSVDQ